MRSMGMVGSLFVGLVTALALGCSSVGSEPLGTVELPAGGIADKGARYRMHGGYTLTSVDTGVSVPVPIKGGDEWVVRSDIPAGTYRVSIDPGLEITWLDRSPPPGWFNHARAIESSELLVVSAGKVAEVHLRSITQPGMALAQR
jgi:hypothetical protein